MPSHVFSIERTWRIIATGIAFASFMIGGLVMTLTAFPLAWAWPGLREIKERRIGQLIQISFFTFLKFLAFLGVMRPPRVEGLENLTKAGPCLVIANHPTLIDVVLLLSLVRNGNCVVKRALWDHFFLGGVVRATGYIPNDNGPGLIERCDAGFRQGRPLIIFPEGTRSPENGLYPFNRGAVQIALRTGVPLVPAFITCFPPTLMKHQRWYEVPERAVQLTLRFHPRMVLPDEILQKRELPQQVRALTRHCEAFFRREMSSARPVA